MIKVLMNASLGCHQHFLLPIFVLAQTTQSKRESLGPGPPTWLIDAIKTTKVLVVFLVWAGSCSGILLRF